MKIIFRLLIAFSLYAIYQFAFADGSGGNFDTTSGGLTIAPADQSVRYLGLMFGQVGGVLNGTGTQLLGVMFGEFNRAVMILGTIVFTYVYGKGILDTAAHGEFLGKQTNSVWVPLRSIFGIAMMIPSAATGYCVAQVFLMWVVMQGVGAADMVWAKAVHYMSSYSGASNKTQEDITKAMTDNGVSAATQQIFSDMVCLAWVSAYSKGKGYPSIYPTSYPSSDSNGSVRLSPMQSKNNQYSGYNFDYILPSGTAINCGGVSWQTDDGVCSGASTTGECSARKSAQQRAVYNIITTYQPIAKEYVHQAMLTVPPPGPATTVVLLYPQTPQLSAYPINVNNAAGQAVYNYAGSDFYDGAINMYVGNITNALNQYNQDQSDNSGVDTSHEVNQGWIYAGSYFYRFSKQAGGKGPTVPSFSAVGPQDINSDSFAESWANNVPFGLSSQPGNSDQFVQSVGGAGDSGGNPNQGNIDSLSKGLKAGGIATAVIFGLGAAIAAVPQPGVAVFLGTMGAGMAAFFITISNIVGNTTDILLPIKSLAILGHVLLYCAGIAWVALVVLTFLTSLGKGIMTCMQPLQWASDSAETYLSGMAFSMLGMFLTIGFFLAVYIPLLPFIYFFFGVLSWLVAVVETMIAGPIVALGIVHPEGHDLWGKAEPAVMLTVNVFLRPMLLLFGFVASTLLSFVGIQILTNGYSLLMGNDTAVISADPLSLILSFILYTFLITIVIQQSFKLTLEVPNRVLQWLGAQGQLGGNVEEAAQQFKQAEATVAADVQGGFSRSEQNVRESTRKADEKKKKGDSDGLQVGSGNEGGGGAGGGGPTEAQRAMSQAAQQAAQRGRTP